jgi:hypothetical protein
MKGFQGLKNFSLKPQAQAAPKTAWLVAVPVTKPPPIERTTAIVEEIFAAAWRRKEAAERAFDVAERELDAADAAFDLAARDMAALLMRATK